MNYIDTGCTDKPVLTLLHGLGSCKEVWKYQLELSTHYRLILIDLLGHGTSETNRLHASCIVMQTLAEGVFEVWRKLGITRTSLCGLSLGGLVVQEIVRQEMYRGSIPIVNSIILANTTAVVPYHIGAMTVNRMERELGAMTDEEYARKVVKQCVYDASDTRLIHDLSANGFHINRESYVNVAKATVGVNYIPTLMFSGKRALIIGSANDTVTPYSNAIAMRSFMFLSQLKLFTECGHLPNAEKADEFNETVFNFLEGKSMCGSKIMR